MGATIEVFARASAAVDYNAAQGMITESSGGSPGSSSVATPA